MSELKQEEKNRYAAILREELIPAMGCTEPIAIAYAASVAGKVLGEEARRMELSCSGNIIKNVKAVVVPNAGGQKGIAVAGILGLIGGNPEKQLEVIADVTRTARAKRRASSRRRASAKCSLRRMRRTSISRQRSSVTITRRKSSSRRSTPTSATFSAMKRSSNRMRQRARSRALPIRPRATT